MGLPGCGKTTLVDGIVQKLNNMGYSIITEKELYANNSFLHKIVDMVCSFLCMRTCLFNLKLIRILLPCIRMKCKIYVFKRYMKLIKYNKRIDRALKYNVYGYIITSEGFVQMFISIFDFMPYSEKIERMIEEYSQLLKRIMPEIVYCNIDINTAIERIKIRNDPRDSFLGVLDESRRFILGKRKKNNEIFLEYFAVITVSMNNTVDRLVTKVVDSL